MFRIIRKVRLTPLVYYMEVEAARLAKSARPGQFLIVRATENGERVPLTICDIEPTKGYVSVVIQIAGVTTDKICRMEEGDSFLDVLGPLGRPSEIVDLTDAQLKEVRYLFIAGGVGTAPVFPEAKFLHERGAKVDIVLGARNKDLIILKERLSAVCDNLYVCTDDGSEGLKGNVTDMLDKLMSEGKSYTQAVAIGPMVMMKFAALTAKKYALPMTVSINTLMVDGTGMCGACRIKVGDKTKFACVDGPEFDAYEVDFDEALRRQRLYFSQEQEADRKAGLDCLVKK